MSTAKKPIPVVVLCRVSTAKQDTSRQAAELAAHATAEGWRVVETITETASGNDAESEREGLERVLELARSKKVNKVLVHEVSRIARRNSTVHRFVEELCDLGVSVYWHAQGIETLMRSGKRNPSASVMLALLAEMARAERETLVERIQSGLVEARRKGRRLGRPPGSAITPAALLRKHRDIVRMLRHGQSVRNTAKITGKGMSTVQRVKRAMDGQSSLT